MSEKKAKAKTTTKEKKPAAKAKKEATPKAEPAPSAPAPAAPTNTTPPATTNAISTTPFIPGEIFTGRHLTHYDETAGVAIPASEVDAHIMKSHKVRTLIEAYSDRYERLRVLLTTKLLPKREHLLQVYRKLKENSETITQKGKIIEKETLTDTERILERLKSAISLRQSSIQHELIHVEEELGTIEGIMRRVERANQVTPNPTGIILTSVNPTSSSTPPQYSNPLIMAEVIQEYGELSSLINQTANKMIQLQVDFPTDDFPRETSDRLEILNRCDRYIHAMNVKDHLLWLALQDKEKLQQKLEESQQYSHELELEVLRWGEVGKRYEQELIRIQAEKTDVEKQNYHLRQLLMKNGIYVE